MITTEGRAYEQRGIVYVKTCRPAVDNLSDEVTVLWHDSRMRTAEQNRKAWALMTEIAVFQGEDKDTVYKEQSLEFTSRNLEVLQGMLFHLSTATVSEASAFITMLVEIIIEYGIPTKEPLVELCEDVQKAVYFCLLHKACAVSRRKAELHHVDAVGMGYNRREKPQIGALVLPLAREYHMECHNIGNEAFMRKYHLEPVRLDERLAKVYGLTEKARREGNYGQV
jgi:hypothetical protein